LLACPATALDLAGLPKELTFTSFGRHAGATESMTSGLTEFELMKKGVVAAQGDGQIPAR
jgi:hypothetical protein